MNKTLKIGLFGFGCVGQGLYHVLNNSTGFKAEIVKIAVKHKNKSRNVKTELIIYNKEEILNDPNVDVVVELIDDADEAFLIVREALQKGKHVVTANKKMLALHLEELYKLQKENQLSLLYEGAACGSIPIIRTLEEYFDNEDLEKVSGIFNGTSNYILSQTLNEGLSYAQALKQAQDMGFAESAPCADVEGFDAKYKAVLLALHAFGLIVNPQHVLNFGISTLQEKDIRYAFEKGYKIKLTPLIKRLDTNSLGILVTPQFIKPENLIFGVENEFNGVIVEGKFSGEQFLQGRGAGSYPTGAAVLSDISALSHGYKYEFKKHIQQHRPEFTNNILVNIYLRYNTVLDLEKIEFTEVSEKYTGSDYNYIIGKIRLQDLILQKEYILQNKLFFALVDDQITLDHSPSKQIHSHLKV